MQHGLSRRAALRASPRCLLFLLCLLSVAALPASAIVDASSATARTGIATQAASQVGPGQVVTPQADLAPAQLYFHHLSAEQGISSDITEATVQDASGFIWIASGNGLNRYDGANVTVYQHRDGDPSSLSVNTVYALFVDGSGTLWVGTTSGLNAYDRSTDSFKVYLHDPDKPGSLSSSSIRSIFQDRAGTMWVGTDGGGLNRFDPATGTFTAYRHDPADPQSISSDIIYSIYEDRAGTLWLATYGGGLSRFDPATGVFTAYRHDPDDPRSISSDLTYVITQTPGSPQGTGDPAGVVEGLWIGTWGGGLNRFDPATGTFTAYRHDPKDAHSLPDDRVMALCFDGNGALWTGTFSGGVSILDPDAQSFTAYRNDITDSNSLSHNSVVHIYRDSSELMWVSTEGGGINLHNPRQRAFTTYRNSPTDPNSLASNGIYAIYEDPTSLLWVGTQDRGLDSMDRRTGKITHYPPDPTDPHKLGFPTVFYLHGDRRGAIWVATYGGGLYRLDLATGVFTAYRHDPANPRSISSDSVTAIAEDATGALWISTADGLNRLDTTTGVFTQYNYDPANARSLTGEDLSLSHVIVARDGTVWTCGPSGLNHLDPATGLVTRYQHDPNNPNSLADNYIFKVFEDSTGTIWASGLAGTFHRLSIQGSNVTITRYLGSAVGVAENLGSIFEEKPTGAGGGNIWLLRNRSLVKFDRQTDTFHIIDSTDGMPQIQATRAGAMSATGEIFLGSTNGLIVFDPKKLQADPVPPPVVFTQLLLGNKPVSPGANSVLKQSIDQTDAITLNYADRVISLGFAGLSYGTPDRVRYRYRLEGFDPDWIEVGSTRRMATYTNLDPGKYVFRVTAANADGVWNETGRAITLNIVPPWWETLGFRVSIFVLAAMGLVFLYWLRVSSLEKQRLALAKGIAEQTVELARANTALRAQISEREQAEAALQQSNSDLAALNKLALALTQGSDLQGALRSVGGTISALFENGGVSIWLLDPPRKALTRLLAVRGGQEWTENHTISLADDAIASKLIDGASLELIEPPAQLPLIAVPPNLPVDNGAGSTMFAPLQSRGEVLGLLCIRPGLTPESDVQDPNAPTRVLETQDGRALAQTIAGTLSTAIENARLFSEARTAAAEEERQRIARELHDSVSQALYAASLGADVLPALWEADPARGKQAAIRIQDFTHGALAEMRMLMVEMWPGVLVNNALHDLLETLSLAFRARYSLNLQMDFDKSPLLPADVQVALYRIAQEALNNVVKHANAREVTAALKLTPRLTGAEATPWGGEVVLIIEDKGRGFDLSGVRAGGLGLGTMRERAAGIGAAIEQRSEPGQGTCVKVTWNGSARIPTPPPE